MATDPLPAEPPEADAGGRVPDGDPRRCTATKRRGQRCSRWAAVGKTVCHNHGARSTGPRTAAGRLRNVAAKLRHGGRATSDAYKAALRQAHPQLFDAAGDKPDVGRELAFARAKLGALSLDPAAPLAEIARLLDVVRRLADVQAANARDAATVTQQQPKAPGKLTLEVVMPTGAPARDECRNSTCARPRGSPRARRPVGLGPSR